MFAQRLFVITVLASPLLLACSDDGDLGSEPKFTTGDASQGGDSDTFGETGGMEAEGDGDGDSTTGDGDGDGDPNPTTGDGDGDGDGDPDPTTGGDGEPNECGTLAGAVGVGCGQSEGMKGAVALGETMEGLPVSTVYMADNGQDNGAEDWYRFEFPIDPANPRPTAGTASISFAVNQGGDYRFEIYRDCGAQVYGQGLASEFGSSAPPLLEWTFNDLDAGGLEQADYLENVPWPETVWVRVFRFQNSETCTEYQLQVNR